MIYSLKFHHRWFLIITKWTLYILECHSYIYTVHFTFIKELTRFVKKNRFSRIRFCHHRNCSMHVAMIGFISTFAFLCIIIYCVYKKKNLCVRTTAQITLICAARQLLHCMEQISTPKFRSHFCFCKGFQIIFHCRIYENRNKNQFFYAITSQHEQTVTI